MLEIHFHVRKGESMGAPEKLHKVISPPANGPPGTPPISKILSYLHLMDINYELPRTILHGVISITPHPL